MSRGTTQYGMCSDSHSPSSRLHCVRQDVVIRPHLAHRSCSPFHSEKWRLPTERSHAPEHRRVTGQLAESLKIDVRPMVPDDLVVGGDVRVRRKVPAVEGRARLRQVANGVTPGKTLAIDNHEMHSAVTDADKRIPWNKIAESHCIWQSIAQLIDL